MRNFLALLGLAFVLTGCAPDGPRENWNPAPSSSLTKSQAIQLAARCAFSVEPNLSFSEVSATGSMVPFFDSRSVVLCEPYIGQKINKGDVVVFDRGDHPNVAHRVIDVKDGHFFASGDNNQHSDGWFPLSQINRRVVGVLYTAR